MRVLKALKRQLTEDLDPFTKNTVYINISKALTVDCATPHIKRAVENDVTVYETYYDYQQLLTNNKKYPSVAFLLNAIFMAQDMI